jgi:thymidylate synthase (FAD)
MIKGENMKVTLIDYTKNARELLIFAKKTRLEMSPEGFDHIKNMPEEYKCQELDYVFGTIKGSLEFVDYTFMIEEVSRAFTHQLVRHRVGVSFAQQSQRAVDMSHFEYITPKNLIHSGEYHTAMRKINYAYQELINDGVKPEDARGILPTNVSTNILMKINLRSLSDMMSQRLCNRAQEEFREVMKLLKVSALFVHPWAEKLLECYCDKNKKCFFKNGKGCGKHEE